MQPLYESGNTHIRYLDNTYTCDLDFYKPPALPSSINSSDLSQRDWRPGEPGAPAGDPEHMLIPKSQKLRNSKPVCPETFRRSKYL